MRFPGTMMVQTGFDTAEDHIGPFYFEPKGTAAFGGYGFELKAKHCNAMGSVHGGVLMTFADFALCMAATDHYETETCVTVSFSCEFLRGAELGQVIACLPELTEKQVHWSLFPANARLRANRALASVLSSSGSVWTGCGNARRRTETAHWIADESLRGHRWSGGSEGQ